MRSTKQLLNPDLLRAALGLVDDHPGGQSLIWPEIIAALGPPRTKPAVIWLPCGASPALLSALSRFGWLTIAEPELYRGVEAMYLGTPTIVDGRPLFPESAPDFARRWSAEDERQFVRRACHAALLFAARIIVTGLGSGDVSLAERLKDMGAGSHVVARKRFSTAVPKCSRFDDWVLARELTAVRRPIKPRYADLEEAEL